jgi:hypothetical protein
MEFRKTLTRVLLAMGLLFALSAWAQQKPFTRDQVQGLVRDGLGDESARSWSSSAGLISLRRKIFSKASRPQARDGSHGTAIVPWAFVLSNEEPTAKRACRGLYLGQRH